jgi:hypothetical protein
MKKWIGERLKRGQECLNRAKDSEVSFFNLFAEMNTAFKLIWV